MSAPARLERTVAAQPGRHLLFRLDDEVYGVPILSVREIIELPDITPLPQSEPFIRGVINLRGRVLPVLDPKLRFRMSALVPDELTVAVVMQPREGKPVGVLVDEVLEVHLITEAQLADAPDVACPEQQEFLSGVGNLGDRVVFVLDLDALLPSTST